MDFTFGIITSGNNDQLINNLILTIYKQEIPNYEIIIVGSTNITGENIRVIKFDETIKPAWITRKKNIIASEAKYENIVELHDYMILEDDWYNGFLKFGSNFDVCVTKIKSIDGKRFRDFMLYPAFMPSPYCDSSLLPYDFEQDQNINKLMYISGGYIILKKNIALQYPWNEDLSWGMSEDSELCERLTNNNIILKCNQYSCVRIQKQKHQCHWEIQLSENNMQILLNTPKDDILKMAINQRKELKKYIVDKYSIEINNELKN